MNSKVKIVLTVTVLLVALIWSCQKEMIVRGVTSDEYEQWSLHEIWMETFTEGDRYDIEVMPQNKRQRIGGFGACFNELGWRH